MYNIPERITKFISQHHVLTLATSGKNMPWCANCFYAFDNKNIRFIVTSDDNTRHIKEAVQNPLVSGSIVLETKIPGKIRGVQFSGKLIKPNETETKKIKSLYIKKFPYSAAMQINLWIIDAEYIKMTDNRLGFGKKLTWEKYSN
jgi:uncharacterized protein YhbP (UPF0306 family)